MKLNTVIWAKVSFLRWRLPLGKLRILSGIEICKILQQQGFAVVRQKGSHVIMQKISGQTTPDNRVLGIFVYDVSASPNFLALYLAPLVVLTFGYEIIDLKNSLKKNNYFWRVIFYNVAFISMFLALYFSASRAGIGAALIGIVTFLIIKNWLWIKERKIIVILLYCSIVLLFFLGWQMIKPNWQLSSEEGGRITSSNNIRWEIWTTTVRDIIPTGGHWLAGVGLGNYQNYFTMLTKDRVNYPEWISPWALTPHNLFLNIWVNLGLLGLVAFVWILVLFFQNTTKLPQSGLNYLLISVMIAIIVQGSLDSPLWKNDLFLLFWIFLGLIYLNKKLE